MIIYDESDLEFTDMQSLKEKAISAITKHSLLTGGEKVLIGLSGGPDSVCLLHLLHELKERYGLTLAAVYINHNLRPEETPAEIEFCEGLCKKLGIPFLIKSIDVTGHAKGRGMNKQEAARDLRYKTFEETAMEAGFDRIALAHNADDQAETFLMRLIRGSGPKGLSGIPPRRGRVIRPLIEIGRSEIEEYLDRSGLEFMMDSSNLKADYLRNSIRLSLLPELKRMNPNLLQSLLTTMAIMDEEERYFGIIVTKTLMKMISRKTDRRIELFLSPMESMETVILRRVLRRAIEETDSLRAIGYIHIEDIIRLIREGAAGDRLYLPREIRVIKEYSLLVITSERPVRISTYALIPGGEVAVQGAGAVIRASYEESKDDLGDGKSEVLLDADQLQLPLRIRPREKGDFFFPLGFGKRKKLQDFFVDAKVPRDVRDSIPLVVSGDDIVWIAGYRADERFRVTGNTKKFLRIGIVKGKF